MLESKNIVTERKNVFYELISVLANGHWGKKKISEFEDMSVGTSQGEMQRKNYITKQNKNITNMLQIEHPRTVGQFLKV